MIGLRPSPSSGAKTAADTRPQPRTPHSPSYIPLFSPKATRSPPPSSSLPSSLSVPHLGLVPPNRTPSGSGPPPQSAIPQPSASSAHASGGTSLPSLRALRSFLPFGSGKTPSSTAVPGPSSKNPFASFTPGRRSSVNIERKNSGQFPRSGDENNDATVISIAPPSQENPKQTQASGSAPSADALEPSLPSLSTSHEDVGTCGGTCDQLHHMAADPLSYSRPPGRLVQTGASTKHRVINDPRVGPLRVVEAPPCFGRLSNLRRFWKRPPNQTRSAVPLTRDQ